MPIAYTYVGSGSTSSNISPDVLKVRGVARAL